MQRLRSAYGAYAEAKMSRADAVTVFIEAATAHMMGAHLL